MAEQQEGSSPLFAIFILSIYSLLLIPTTIYRLCSAAGSEDVVKPWEATRKKKPSLVAKYLRRLRSPGNLLVLAAWIVWFFLIWYVQKAAQDLQPFDPFEILQVPRDADKSTISRAYRKAAIEYHPDKNPDPAATRYFAEFITKAYKALTDEVARKNYEQYGHPDGPQAIKLNVALPEWLINGDQKAAPLLLGGLVLFGILAPLGIAARYLLVSHKFTGPNSVMQETVQIFLQSKFAVKESQSLAKIPDTLVFAMEFINLPVPNDQATGLEELRKTVLRLHPDLKDKSPFWKRKSSIVKAHMLLLVHLGREEIPDSLAADHKYVITKAALLCEEMVKIASLPRPPNGLGWLAPIVGSVEMMQCLTQGVPIASRKALGQSGKMKGEATLAQLPWVDTEVLKRLGRKRIRSLSDLLGLSAKERRLLLTSAGLTQQQAEDAGTSLLSIPSVTISEVTCGLEGEEGDVMEGDVVTCTAQVTLSRPSHSQSAFKAPPRGSSVQAFAPLFPGSRQERWWLCLADANKNAVLCLQPENLLTAEAAGVVSALHSHQAAAQNGHAGGGGSDSEEEGSEGTAGTLHLTHGGQPNGRSQQNGIMELAKSSGGRSKQQRQLSNGNAQPERSAEPQKIEMRFPAPSAGRFDLTLYCLSDCWVGSDVAVPLRLRVLEASRAEREGRAQRARELAEAEAAAGSEDEDEPEDGEDEDGGDGEYDSEETGTEESGSDVSDDDSAPELINAADAESDHNSDKKVVVKKQK